MVSKRRSIKRQRRQRQQRAYTVKGGEKNWVSKLKRILSIRKTEDEDIDADTMNLLNSSASEQSDTFNGVGSFIYNGQTYSYHFNTTTGLIKILNSNQSNALCYIKLYDGIVLRSGGVNLYTNIIKDPTTILKQEIEYKDIDNISVQAYTNKKKLKFIKTSNNEFSSFGILKEFLIYLEKQYKSSEQVTINEEEVIPSVNENPPVSSTNYNANELSELNGTLNTALNCVKIPYDEKYDIVIKDVVLSGPTTGGKSRRKISTRQIRDIIENSIKFGGDGDRALVEADKNRAALVEAAAKIKAPPQVQPRQRSQQVINLEEPLQEQEEQELEQQEKEQQEKEQQVLNKEDPEKQQKELLKQLQEEQEEQEKQQKLNQIQNEINEIIKNITLPNGLKIERLDIEFKSKLSEGDLIGSGGGKSTRRRHQTRMKTRKQYKSRN